VTHAFNQEQRYTPLTFSPSGPGSLSRTVTAPSSADEVPPGYYLLFFLNDLGYPSIGKFVRVWGIVKSSVQVAASSSCIDNQSRLSLIVTWLTSLETEPNVMDRLEVYPPATNCPSGTPFVRQTLPNLNDRRSHQVTYTGPCQIGTWKLVIKSYLNDSQETPTESTISCQTVTVSGCASCSGCPPGGSID
jgi:hypothetical protein